MPVVIETENFVLESLKNFFAAVENFKLAQSENAFAAEIVFLGAACGKVLIFLRQIVKRLLAIPAVELFQVKRAVRVCVSLANPETVKKVRFGLYGVLQVDEN